MPMARRQHQKRRHVVERHSSRHVAHAALTLLLVITFNGSFAAPNLDSLASSTSTLLLPLRGGATGSPALFREVCDDSLLARTMRGSRQERTDPHSLETPGAEPLRMSHGTTTVALACRDGVVAAVDSRASMGSFVGSRTTQKVIPVSNYILGTMAGGAADCTFWLRVLAMQAKIFEGRNGFPMPVAAAARLLADTLMGQRGRRLSVGTMVMGCDRHGAGQVFYVDNDGARVKGQYFSVGSGSTYAYSVLDEGYRPDLTLSEAAKLAKTAVRHATFRDAFSGGFINVFVVTASGWERLSADDAGFLDMQSPDEAPTSGVNVATSPSGTRAVQVEPRGDDDRAARDAEDDQYTVSEGPEDFGAR